jgi:hypothetical protein
LLHLRLSLLGYELTLRPPFNLPLLETQHKRRDSLPVRRFCGSNPLRFCGGTLIRLCGSALVVSLGNLLPLNHLFQARSRPNLPGHGIDDRLGVGSR